VRAGQPCLRAPVGSSLPAAVNQVRSFPAVLRIRIDRIRMFLGLLDPDPDPLVRGMDPDAALSPPPVGSSLPAAVNQVRSFQEVLRIRICMVLDLLDPDPLVRGMNPDPSVIKQ
jgi:hypothetical protein